MLKIMQFLCAAAFAGPALAADAVTCEKYARQVERLVMLAVNDPDISQAAKYKAGVWCGVLDTPPLEISIDDDQGTAPATEKPVTTDAGFPPEWIAKCKSRYVSFREADGSVLRRHSRSRVLCPVKL